MKLTLAQLIAKKYYIADENLSMIVDEVLEAAADLFQYYHDDDKLEPRYVQDRIRELKTAHVADERVRDRRR